MNKSKSTLFAVPAFLLATHLFAEQRMDVDIVKLSSATNAVVSTGAGFSSLPAAYVTFAETGHSRYTPSIDITTAVHKAFFPDSKRPMPRDYGYNINPSKEHFF